MLLFDFDGVLLSSVKEVALTSYNAINPDDLKLRLEELPRGFLKLFCNNRFHVQPACDFIPLGYWCLENLDNENKILEKKEFFEILNKTKTSKIERQSLFFSARDRLSKENKTNWNTLNKPYEPLWSELRNYADRVIILTNKNLEAVIELCSYFNLGVKEENIYAAREDGGGKVYNFRLIENRFKETKVFYFIDDSIKNLDELRNSVPSNKLKMILATWGYNGGNDTKEALKKNYKVYGIEEFTETLPTYYDIES